MLGFDRENQDYRYTWEGQIPWILQAVMLALALGITTGVAFSVGGWIAMAIVLFVTVVSGSAFAGTEFLTAAMAIVAVVLAYNTGLLLGIVPRVALTSHQPTA